MPNIYVNKVLSKIIDAFGKPQKVGTGNSLYYFQSINVHIYFRYSKISFIRDYTKAFYGLRNEDLKLLQGKNSFICFVWDNDDSPILIPFNHFEYYFSQYQPSSDRQYKVLLFFKKTGTEFYIAKAGKFNVDSYYGTKLLYDVKSNDIKVPKLSHSQVQSLIGAIGIKKGFNIWYPLKDRNSLDYSIITKSKIRKNLPNYSKDIDNIISEVDVIWLDFTKPMNLFEVEHSTPIYSGLLRFNDILLTIGGIQNLNIVAEYDRENKFSREINRPTFKQSKLIEKVAFMNYENVYHWYYNLYGRIYETKH